jgi:site-specific recombinase XerD
MAVDFGRMSVRRPYGREPETPAVPRINTATSRAHLAPRREPYWDRVEAKHYIGFRSTGTGGAGTWVARRRREGAAEGQGAQEYVALGEHPDYDSAVRAARVAWKAPERASGETAPTVRTACERHVKAILAAEGKRKADETAARFDRLVYPTPLASIPLHKLRPTDVEDWRNKLAATPAKVTRRKGKDGHQFRPRADATVNRDLVPLRAALNRAHDDGLVASDAAWRAKLKPKKGVGARREVYLDAADRKALIDKAGDEVKPFLRALAALPLRPGAVAALIVGDFDKRLGTLRIGTDKAGAERRIKLPPTTAALFADATRGKLPTAPLFGRADGRAWDKDSWWEPTHAAALAAKLPPATSAYSLRHATITDLVVGGLDPLTVATLSGTSIAMIQKYYGHLVADRAAAALASLVS